MLLQATAAESASMRSDAVAAGAVPLLANVLKDGMSLAPLASLSDIILQCSGASFGFVSKAKPLCPTIDNFCCIYTVALHADTLHILL